MIHSSVYLERWGSDCWPDAKWCACDLERIECIQRDSMLAILGMLAKAAQKQCYEPFMRGELSTLVANIENAINATFNPPSPPEFVRKGAPWLDSDLPTVVGKMSCSHADFQRGCLVLLRDVQQDPHCHLGLIQILCEAVRCSRECCDLSSQLQDLAAKVLLKAKQENDPKAPYFHHPNE